MYTPPIYTPKIMCKIRIVSYIVFSFPPGVMHLFAKYRPIVYCPKSNDNYSPI
jgi:hypothetical protein